MTRYLVMVLLAAAIFAPAQDVNAGWGNSIWRPAFRRAAGREVAEREAAAGGTRAMAGKFQKERTAQEILRADRVRDAATPVRILKRERAVQRYTTAAEARREAAAGIPAGAHMTSHVNRGRPLSAESAMRKYGLPKVPQRVISIRVPARQPVRLNKALAGRPGVGELTSTKPIRPSAVLSVRPLERRSIPASR